MGHTLAPTAVAARTQSQDCALKDIRNKLQDLLRAVLIFASSGLDSVVKQLVKDALAGCGKMRFCQHT
jgi:hypothetical protein